MARATEIGPIATVGCQRIKDLKRPKTDAYYVCFGSEETLTSCLLGQPVRFQLTQVNGETEQV